MKSQADYSSTEFYEFVEQALHDLEKDLYRAGKEGRQAVYKTLLAAGAKGAHHGLSR